VNHTIELFDKNAGKIRKALDPSAAAPAPAGLPRMARPPRLAGRTAGAWSSLTAAPTGRPKQLGYLPRPRDARARRGRPGNVSDSLGGFQVVGVQLRDHAAQPVIVGHAFVQNLRRGRYEVRSDVCLALRIDAASTELARDLTPARPAPHIHCSRDATEPATRIVKRRPRCRRGARPSRTEMIRFVDEYRIISGSGRSSRLRRPR
jgi:hypothetical protein